MSEPQERFSRLTALSKLNVVPEYERIRSKTAFVIGVGGVGSVAAEMLVRCGVGRIFLFDYDKVELVNMNRMFYTPDQVGMYKVEAAKSSLDKISQGSCEIFTFNGNICNIDIYSSLLQLIRMEQARIDHDPTGVVLLCCVENYAARVTINRACIETNQIWLESGVSETAISAHVQFMRPGISACFDCAPPVIVASGGDEKTLVRPGVCAASLPTTMSIMAGIMVQACLKYFLSFGTVSGCVGYDALTDYFPVYDLKPNPECSSELCKQLQTTAKPPVACETRPNADSMRVHANHDSNEWGISVIDSAGNDDGMNEVSPGDVSQSSLNALSIEELKDRLKRK